MFSRIIHAPPFLLLLGCLSFPAWAEEGAEEGRTLHEANCNSCHAAMFDGEAHKIYTRNNSRVDSLSALENQIRRCESNLKLEWFDSEIKAVTDYLNKQFYQFEQ